MKVAQLRGGGGESKSLRRPAEGAHSLLACLLCHSLLMQPLLSDYSREGRRRNREGGEGSQPAALQGDSWWMRGCSRCRQTDEGGKARHFKKVFVLRSATDKAKKVQPHGRTPHRRRRRRRVFTGCVGATATAIPHAHNGSCGLRTTTNGRGRTAVKTWVNADPSARGRGREGSGDSR